MISLPFSLPIIFFKQLVSLDQFAGLYLILWKHLCLWQSGQGIYFYSLDKIHRKLVVFLGMLSSKTIYCFLIWGGF